MGNSVKQWLVSDGAAAFVKTLRTKIKGYNEGINLRLNGGIDYERERL